MNIIAHQERNCINKGVKDMRKISDIVNALNDGAELVYIAGKFGGYAISYNGLVREVRKDYAREAIERLHIKGASKDGKMVYTVK